MTANALCGAAVSRRQVITGLIILIPLPTLGKEPAAKAFLDEIYRHYVGGSTSAATGIVLTDAKVVRAYFTVGLASLIIEDRTLETKRSDRRVLEGDPFVGHREWDISKLAIEVTGIGVLKATGKVTFTNDGKSEKIILELQRSGNDWRIADIEWNSGGSIRGAFRRKAVYDTGALPP
jgi:hypothetical protein